MDTSILSTTDLFGISVKSGTTARALSFLEGAIERRENTMVTFANANLINHCLKDDSVHRAVRNSVVLNDGSGVQLANRLLNGRSFPENLNGTDLVPRLLEHCNRPLRIFLLGSRAEVLAKAADFIAERFPQHQVVGAHHGYFAKADEQRVVDNISAHSPDLLLVALGNPIQELFLARNFRSCNATLGLAVGGLFDFWSGNVERAPKIMQQLGVEWLFRLAQEPQRLWRRYIIGNVTFVWAVLTYKLSRQSRLPASE